MDDARKGKARQMFQVLSAAGLLEHFEWNNDRIRAEARAEALNDVLNKCEAYLKELGEEWIFASLKPAILADEPKEERQGCFRCRNRPQPGGDRQLCDSCRLIVGQNYDPAPLADEPKEEREVEGPEDD